MLDSALLSVIIPVYNGEKTLEHMVYSILNQPRSDLIEIVIVNDGSTDNTADICEKLKTKNDRIKVFHKENGGVSTARNLGIEKAEGKYLNFSDADDWWVENFFDDEIVPKFEIDTDLICFGRMHISPKKRYKKAYFKGDYIEEFNLPDSNRYDWSYYAVTTICRKEFIQNNKLLFPIGMKCAEDVTFLSLAFGMAHKIEHSSRIMYCYYQNVNSVVHNMDIYETFYFSRQRLKIIENAFKKIDCYNEMQRYEDISMICDAIPNLCGHYSYKRIQDILHDNMNNIFFDTAVQPWPNRVKMRNNWLKFPYLSYVYYKVFYGIYHFSNYIYFKFTGGKSNLMETIVFGLIKHWDRV